MTTSAYSQASEYGFAFADIDEAPLHDSGEESSGQAFGHLNAAFLERFLREKDTQAALRLWFDHTGERGSGAEDGRQLLWQAIDGIDELLEAQVNAILHHAEFKQLESSWRSLHYLVKQSAKADREQRVKIKLISLSWAELSRDIARVIEFDQSDFHRLIHDSEFDHAGGEPFGLIIGDYALALTPQKGLPTNDLDVLSSIARTAEAAFVPFIASVTPSFLGVESFGDLGSVNQFHQQFELPEYVKWRAFREREEARYIGLVLPQVLMRAPYETDSTRSESFRFREHVRDEQDYLWGNGAYCLGAVMIRAFAETGWFSHVRNFKPGQEGQGLVCDLPELYCETERYQHTKLVPLNLQIGDKLERAMSETGFIPALPVPRTNNLVFLSNSSLMKPKRYSSDLATVNVQLSSMLQYTLCVSRIAHYIKHLGRDKVGKYESAGTIENELQRWLHQYTTASDTASDEVRARYPLGEAKIKVKAKAGEPGHYYSVIRLRPHLQMDQMVSSVRLVTELSAGR
ncbi:type VI secretion system contractile sheath large subunit [Pokkaliibacter sp. CJK22405]|uniref:type VI secretion system contractile sheath large subunit n=1 Tax=Pokkaliibacter sp. CJK22405 TaxID=3384615 RepID=UPI0039851916